MRVNQPFEWLCTFWLPTLPAMRVCGTLLVSASGWVKAELLGALGNEVKFDAQRFELVHGETDDGKLLTLTDCYVHTSVIALLAGTAKSQLRAQRLIVGAQLTPAHMRKFSRISLSVEKLDEWVETSAVKASRARSGNVQQRALRPTITVSLPPVRKFSLDEGLDLSINFRTLISLKDGLHGEAKVAAFLQVDCASGKTIDEVGKLAYRINTFFCLVFGETVSIDWLSAKAPETEAGDSGAQSSRELQLYFPSRPNSETPPVVDRHSMILLLRNVKSSLRHVLQRWINDYEVLWPTFDLFFASTTTSNSYVETRFLTLVQSLEVFRRRTSDTTVMSKAVFRALRSQLLDVCPKDRQEWLKRRLDHANELSLSDRVSHLLRSLRSVIGDSLEVEPLVREIVKKRNDLTHYGNARRQNRSSGTDLLRLSMKVEAILALLFLKRIGISTRLLKVIVSTRSSLTEKLRGTFFETD